MIKHSSFLVFLLISAISCNNNSDVKALDDLKYCDIERFTNTYFVQLTHRGLIVVDANHTSFEQLNEEINMNIRKEDAEDLWTFPYKYDHSVNLFYLSAYTNLLVTSYKPNSGGGYEFMANVLSMSQFRGKKSVFIGYNSSLWENSPRIDFVDDGIMQRDLLSMCDARNISFIPSRNHFVIRVNQTIECGFPSVPEGKRSINGLFIRHENAKCEASEHKELITDYNNQVDVDGGRLWADPTKTEDQRGTYYLNQLESGSFKFVTEEFNGTFYYVMTGLDSSNIFEEVNSQRCIVRKGKKIPQSTANISHEHPRMLIMPKIPGAPLNIKTPAFSAPLAPENVTTDADSGADVEDDWGKRLGKKSVNLTEEEENSLFGTKNPPAEVSASSSLELAVMLAVLLVLKLLFISVMSERMN